MSKIARIPVSTGPAGVPGLVRWIKATHPNVYRQLAARVATFDRVNGMGLIPPASIASSDPVASVASQPSMAQTIVNTVKDIAAVALPLYQQQKIFDIQLKRAAANQPMLDTSAISDASSVKLGVDASTRRTVMWVAGGVAGVYLLSKLLARR